MDNIPASNNIYSKMMALQLKATLVVAIVAYFLNGVHAALSVVAGGLSVVIGAWFATKIVAKTAGSTEPTTVLFNLLKAEAVKIAIVGLLLFLVFKFYHQLVPFALIVGLAAAAFLSGAALAKDDRPI
jgi:ATP synthase protein I